MVRFLFYVNLLLVIIILQSCASENESIKEGCINKNTLQVVVFIPQSSLPQGKKDKDIIVKEALKISDKRCEAIITGALTMNNKTFESRDAYVVSWKIGLIHKKPNGHVVQVDYTLRDEIASLLHCK
ncbi:MAG: hypothetical protein N3F66_04370 [Spirochaetes bacterium]|nr:hypothetical protein [Spirochaetota bacterium]